MSTRVRIEYALVAGRLAHIDEFSGLRRGNRPSSSCEACQGALVMRLGEQRAHHFAHRSDAACVLQHRETALHYNTKNFLAAFLRTASTMVVRFQCQASREVKCTRSILAAAAEGWREVVVESPLRPLRPDIQIVGGMPERLVIEIFSSHKVHGEKRRALGAQAVPWIEVPAGFELNGWTESDPIPVVQIGGFREVFCSQHTPAVAVQAAKHARSTPRSERNNRSSASRPSGVPLYFRVVDCYPESTPRVRRTFWILKDENDGSFILQDTTAEFVISRCARPFDQESMIGAFDRALTDYLERLYYLTDSPMRWESISAFPRRGLFSQELYPPRFVRSLSGDGWRAIRDADELWAFPEAEPNVGTL